MDKPANPATPFREVYQHFLAVLKKHGRKESTRAKYLYDFKRFERWLRAIDPPLKSMSCRTRQSLRPRDPFGRAHNLSPSLTSRG
jgi:hypothetical protein